MFLRPKHQTHQTSERKGCGKCGYVQNGVVMFELNIMKHHKVKFGQLKRAFSVFSLLCSNPNISASNKTKLKSKDSFGVLRTVFNFQFWPIKN